MDLSPTWRRHSFVNRDLEVSKVIDLSPARRWFRVPQNDRFKPCTDLNLYLLPVNARINASAMSICDLILALYQNNTKCSNKSSFVKLSKMIFFCKSWVFLLKRFCFERLLFFYFFSCVWRHLLGGFLCFRLKMFLNMLFCEGRVYYFLKNIFP